MNVNASFKDNATIDAFGRLRVSEPFTLLDTKQLYDSLPLFYDDAEVSGSGTSTTYNTNQASTTIGVSDNTAGMRVRQSKLRGTYQPGKSLLILATFVLGEGGDGIRKAVGYFDNHNGIMLEQIDGVLYFNRRTYTSGSVVNNRVAQADWNIEPLNGCGKEEFKLDITKTQILLIDAEWLGVGRVRLGFVIDGKIYYCHEMNHANVLDVVYMSTPNLPVRYEIENDGTGLANSLVHICSSVMSEGGQQATVLQSYVSRNGTPQTLANQDLYTPLLSLRLKADRTGTRISPVLVDVLATLSLNYEWRLYLNPTIAGTDNVSWVDMPNSSLQYDISRNTTNTVSGGHLLGGGYGASSNQSKIPTTGIASSYLTIGTKIDGTPDELVLAVANIDSNGGTMYGGILVDEYS